MNGTKTVWRRAAASLLGLLMLLAAPLALAEELTWSDILERYPGKPVQTMAASLDNTYWRNWQQAREELMEQGMTMDLFTAGGAYLPLGAEPARIATGQFGCFYHADYPEGARLFVVVNKGDVLGTGTLTVAQMVRMAASITNRRPLTGVYALAGDISGDGVVDVLDLVYLAKWLRDSTSRPGSRTADGPVLRLLDETADCEQLPYVAA